MILVPLGLLLVLVGVLTVVFHRAGGVSIAVAGVLVLIVGSQVTATDGLAPVALVLLVLGALAVRTRPGKVLALAGAVVGIGWAVGVAQPPLAPGPQAQGDPVDECGAVAFIGVRGSGEAADAHAGYGGVVGAVRDRLEASLAADGRVLTDLPLAYPALGVTSDRWSLGKDLLTGQSLFLDGAAVGADALAARVSTVHDTCGEATRVVVVGYSQGALVAHVGLARTAPAALASVDAVALIADPARAEGQPGGPREVAAGSGIVWVSPDRSALGEQGVAPALLPEGWRSWCLPDDAVCAWRGPVSGLSSLALRPEVHTQGYTDPAVVESVVAGLLADLVSSTGAP